MPRGGGDGVLVTQGGHVAGWALAVLKGVPTFLYRASDREEALFGWPIHVCSLPVGTRSLYHS